MSLILADVGAVKVLEKYLNTGNNLTMKLFVNNYTPLDTSVAGNFTECAMTGYAAATLTAGSWTVSVNSITGIPEGIYNTQKTFAFTGNLTETVYGYYIIDSSGVLIGAEKADESFAPVRVGDMLVLNPIVQMSYGTPV